MLIYDIALTIGVICIFIMVIGFMIIMIIDNYYSTKYYRKKEQLITEALDKLRYERENRK